LNGGYVLLQDHNLPNGPLRLKNMGRLWRCECICTPGCIQCSTRTCWWQGSAFVVALHRWHDSLFNFW